MIFDIFYGQVLHPDCIEVIKEKMSEPPKKVALFEDVGHGVFLERPRKFIFTLLDFLNSLEWKTDWNNSFPET